MLILLLLVAVWILDAKLSASTQAHYYDLFPSNKGHKNIHWKYLTQRVILLSFIWATALIEMSEELSGVFCFGLIFIYSLFHNGQYYCTRNNLNPDIYKKRFCADSETSQATMEFNFKWRTGMAIMGGIIIIAAILSK